MNIYKVKDGCPLKGKTEQMTEEELQKEYDFHIAESIVANLYKEGKITGYETAYGWRWCSTYWNNTCTFTFWFVLESREVGPPIN